MSFNQRRKDFFLVGIEGRIIYLSESTLEGLCEGLAPRPWFED